MFALFTTTLTFIEICPVYTKVLTKFILSTFVHYRHMLATSFSCIGNTCCFPVYKLHNSTFEGVSLNDIVRGKIIAFEVTVYLYVLEVFRMCSNNSRDFKTIVRFYWNYFSCPTLVSLQRLRGSSNNETFLHLVLGYTPLFLLFYQVSIGELVEYSTSSRLIVQPSYGVHFPY